MRTIQRGPRFLIRPGFHVCTGYVTDKLPQLTELRAQNAITEAEHESAKADALGK